MAKVFISYSREHDRKLAEDLFRYLREHSAPPVDVFLDTNILPGSPWGETLEEQLVAADFLVVLLPPVERSGVLAELNFARERQERGMLRIIPVVVKNRNLPMAFRTAVERFQHLEVAPDQQETVFERILEQVLGAAQLEEQLLAAGENYLSANAAFLQLERLPSWRGRARSQMAAFWDRRALCHARENDRDRSLLAWLEAAALEATERRLREAADLIGEDGAALVMTFHGPAPRNPVKTLFSGLFRPTEWAKVLTALVPFVPSGAVAMSPDGRCLVASWDDCDDAYLWKETGELVATLHHDGPVMAVAISPDNQMIATGSWDGTARLWRSQTGESVGPPLPHKNAVMHVAFSPDGQTLGTASGALVQLWTSLTGEPAATPLKHNQQVLSLAFNADGLSLATQSWDGLRLWRRGEMTPAAVFDTFKQRAVAVDQQLTTVATRGLRSDAQSCLMTTGESLGPPFVHEGHVTSMAMSRDGRQLLTGGSDHVARLWQVPAAGRCEGPRLRHRDTVTAVTFSADEKLALTQSKDRTVRLWRLEQPDLRPDTMSHGGRVTSVCLTPDATTLLSTGEGKTMRIWKVGQVAEAGPVIGLDHTAVFAGLTNDLTSVLTVKSSGGALIWGLNDQQVPSSRVVDAQATRASLSPDGQIIATAGADNQARLWRRDTGEPFGLPLPHEGKITALTFNADGALVLTGTDRHTANIWSVQTGERVGPPLAHRADVSAIAVSMDGACAATASSGKISLWRMGTGTPLGAPIPHAGTIVALLFSPDGKTLGAATHRWVYFIDVDSAKAQVRTARFLGGSLLGPLGIRFNDVEGESMHAALADGGTLFVETIRASLPDSAALSGDAGTLLRDWQTTLALATPLTWKQLVEHDQ